MIVGDFNIHVDNAMDGTARTFLDILDTLNLQQCVKEATHRCGHTLDLVITKKDASPLVHNSINIDQLMLSDSLDHRPVTCSINLGMNKTEVKHVTQTVRNYKSMDKTSFAVDVARRLYVHQILDFMVKPFVRLLTTTQSLSQEK